jgi:hypothetical protein
VCGGDNNLQLTDPLDLKLIAEKKEIQGYLTA